MLFRFGLRVALFVVSLFVVPGGNGSALGAPRVVATINPVHSLVAGVMAGVGEPSLLIGGAASPHHYSLRPSEARLLSRADLVVRVGADFESFLNRALRTLAVDARVLSLDELPGLVLLPARAGGVWEVHADAGGEVGVPTGTDHAGINLHLWLDPQNAKVIVDALVLALAEQDPVNAERYRANGAALHQRLDELDAKLARQLRPVAAFPYVVFHDAYPYLENRYQLKAMGSITVDPDRPVGARRLAEVRRKIRDAGARCVFREPQFEPKLLGLLVEGTGARSGTLDPLGADLPPGPAAYFQLLENLGNALRQCLERTD